MSRSMHQHAINTQSFVFSLCIHKVRNAFTALKMLLVYHNLHIHASLMAGGKTWSKEFSSHASLKFQLVRRGHQRIWHQILRETQILRERTRFPQGKAGGVKPKQYSKPGYRMRMNDNLILVIQKLGTAPGIMETWRWKQHLWGHQAFASHSAWDVGHRKESLMFT